MKIKIFNDSEETNSSGFYCENISKAFEELSLS